MSFYADGSGPVNITDLPKAKTALEAAGFEYDGRDDEACFYPWAYYPGDQRLEFTGEKLRDSALGALHAIAPFVEAGGFVEMHGADDGELWRWAFDGVTVHTLSPTVTWPKLPKVKK